jgi:transcriptional regulator with XRE-family HTH domain
MTLTDELRQALVDSGLTQTEIARRTGLTQPNVSVFLRGGGLYSHSIDRVYSLVCELRKGESGRKRAKK